MFLPFSCSASSLSIASDSSWSSSRRLDTKSMFSYETSLVFLTTVRENQGQQSCTRAEATGYSLFHPQKMMAKMSTQTYAEKNEETLKGWLPSRKTGNPLKKMTSRTNTNPI